MALNKVNYVDNQTIITAQNLNNIQDEIIQNAELIKKAAPQNLLVNSDFRNPVNQRGETSYSAQVYGIDRWRGFGNSCTVNVQEGYIEIVQTPSNTASTKLWGQYVTDIARIRGKTVTIAAKIKGGDVRINVNNIDSLRSLYVANDEWHILVHSITIPNDASDSFYVGLQSRNQTDFMCEWMALYEGEYTAETLPEYQPKGYENELLVCRQYDPLTGEYIGLRKFGQPRNLLDNSDFRNPVNQRGQTSYNLLQGNYGIDRWMPLNVTGVKNTVELTDNGIIFGNENNETVFLTQRFEKKYLDKTKTYTPVECFEDGTISFGGYIDYSSRTDFDIVNLTFPANTKIKWVALYEGEYTTETLPEYQPKGYGTELAECQRYLFRQYMPDSHFAARVFSSDPTKVDVAIPLPAVMIDEYPSCVISDGLECSIWYDGLYRSTCEISTCTACDNFAFLVMQCPSELPAGKECLVRFVGNHLTLSADL